MCSYTQCRYRLHKQPNKERFAHKELLRNGDQTASVFESIILFNFNQCRGLNKDRDDVISWVNP